MNVVESHSLFEIDNELDDLLEQIEEQVEAEGEPSEELLSRFREFCAAHGEKVDLARTPLKIRDMNLMNTRLFGEVNLPPTILLSELPDSFAQFDAYILERKRNRPSNAALTLEIVFLAILPRL